MNWFGLASNQSINQSIDLLANRRGVHWEWEARAGVAAPPPRSNSKRFMSALLAHASPPRAVQGPVGWWAAGVGGEVCDKAPPIKHYQLVRGGAVSARQCSSHSQSTHDVVL